MGWDIASAQAALGMVATGAGALALLEALLVWALWRRVRRVESRLRFLDLPAEQVAVAAEPAALRARLVRLEAQVEECRRRQRLVLSRVGVVRYNAFPDVGGEQSYAVALLNEAGDGVVLSSIFGREQAWTYAKPVRAGASAYPLSDEEREAIARALSSAPRGEDMSALP